MYRALMIGKYSAYSTSNAVAVDEPSCGKSKLVEQDEHLCSLLPTSPCSLVSGIMRISNRRMLLVQERLPALPSSAHVVPSSTACAPQVSPDLHAPPPFSVLPLHLAQLFPSQTPARHSASSLSRLRRAFFEILYHSFQHSRILPPRAWGGATVPRCSTLTRASIPSSAL